MERPFDEVVREHGATVLRVCRAVLGPGADAEDAWSEAFLSALRAWPALDPGADVRGWLITIAHRKAIDVTRSRSRRAVPVPDPPDAPSRWGNPEPADTELWAAVRGPPAKQRQCLAYHHLAGLPYAEVAAVVGGSTEAARRAAADGIKALRAQLAERIEERNNR